MSGSWQAKIDLSWYKNKLIGTSRSLLKTIKSIKTKITIDHSENTPRSLVIVMKVLIICAKVAK